MKAYILFLVVIVAEWLLLFPDAKLTLGPAISYNQKKLYVVLVCIEMIAFAGLRATDLGADTTTYLDALRYYSALPRGEILSAPLVPPFDFEIGYFWLTKLCAWLSVSETGFLILIAALTYVPVCWFILQYSENPLIGILVYFAFGHFTYSLGIFRQMIAISITLVGVKYILERKLVKYVLIIALAMTFHTTAIIMLPLYWCYRLKLENKLLLIFVAEAICFVCARSLVLFAVKLFPQYSGYVASQYDTQGGGYLMLGLSNLVLAVGCMIENRKENRDNIVLRMSVNSAVIAVFLLIIGQSMGIFGRVTKYYSVFWVILIPSLMNRCFKKNIAFVHTVGMVGLIAIFYLLAKGSPIDPYSSVILGWI